MDLNILAENLGLNREEFIELVNVFLTTANKDIQKFNTAVESSDFAKAAEAAHSLKGSSGNMGFLDLSEIAKKAEMDARANKLDKAGHYMQLVKEHLVAIEKAK